MSQPNPNTDRRTEIAIAAFTAAVAALSLSLVDVFARIIRRGSRRPQLRIELSHAAHAAADELTREAPALIDAVAQAVTGTPPPPPRPGQTVQDAEQAALSLGERAARIIREDLHGRVNVLALAITRSANDVYQAVASDAAIDEVLGLTPAQAQHQAYEAFLRRGITGFTDRSGRRWTLEAYVDMAVRAAVQRGFNEARIQAAQEVGFHDFIVSEDGDPCPLCQPWERQVLSDGLVTAPAVASIADATGAGLFHPRCKHVLSPFAGTEPPPPPAPWSAEDAERYAESQHQRRLERRIRAAKRQVAGALNPGMKRAAQQRLRRAQKAMRDFIDQTGRVRIPRREQTHL